MGRPRTGKYFKCRVCSNKFWRKISEQRIGKTNYCSVKCSSSAHTGSSNAQYKHGDIKSAEYRIWAAMKRRCNNPNVRDYAYYGGRGIKICDRWSNGNGYTHFLEDMGRRPYKHASLDRIDNDGNYEPTNCRWSSKTKQNNNTRRNIIVRWGGQDYTVAELAKILEVYDHLTAIYGRLERGWDKKDAFLKPFDGTHHQRRQVS